MKKALCIILSLFIVVLSAFALFVIPSGTNPAAADIPETGTFRLPASLRVIGEEAFEGTAAAALVMGVEVTTVESRAFAGTDSLREVYIPASAETLAEDAFDGTEELTVYGTGGSAAEDWAARLGYRFVLRDIWTDILLQPSHALFLLLLLFALAAGAAGSRIRLRLNRTASAVEYLSLSYKKRAELFVRNLCFP